MKKVLENPDRAYREADKGQSTMMTWRTAQFTLIFGSNK